MKHVNEKQWDKRIVERALEMIGAGFDDEALDNYFATAGLKHAAAKKVALNDYKQERRKEATANRLRAKLQSRKSGM
jgi:hypothetical protein